MLPLQKQCHLAEDRLQYNVSVPYPKLGLENTGNIELGAAPLVQYYSVFSSLPSLGYGTLIHCLKCLFHTKIALLSKQYTMPTQLSSFSMWKKTFRALVCQMCGNYSKTESEIMKHYQKDHIIFFSSKLQIFGFPTIVKNTKPTSLDSSSDKPKSLIRNIAS